MIENYDSWNIYEGFSEGSGRSEKIWLISPDQKKVGLFKFPKSSFTTEHISERLAYILAKKLKVSCAEVHIGTRNNRIGCMSYIVTKSNEFMIEGIAFINARFPEYDTNLMFDKKTKCFYSLDLILECTNTIISTEQVLEFMIFDFLIGNSDRHQSNWALIGDQTSGRLYRAPLYDNGSSLCCYVTENSINAILSDSRRLLAQIDSKSNSKIRICKDCKKEPSHKTVLIYLLKNYPTESFRIASDYATILTEDVITELLAEFDSSLLSKKKKTLIKLFLLEKIKILKECIKESRR